MKFNKIPLAVGLLVFALYYWLAFRCIGYDWSVSETFGEIIATGAKQGSGFPYFSYFYNGGVYLAHDPQAWVSSPLFKIFVSLTGAIAGARWLGVAYGVLGYFSTYFWLRTRFTRTSSTFGALALVLSLGMFWRLVAGHMLFLLEMMLPFFLLAIFRLDLATSFTQKVKWVIAMALAGAWMIYEPGFHALFYFVIPGILIEMGLRLFYSPKATAKLLLPLSAAALLSGFMILPKILAWKSLAMTRAPDATDGTLALKDVIGALFITARSTVMGFRVPGSNPERWHFIFEVNSALMPIASLLALVGIYYGIRRRWYREKNFRLAVGCLLFSVLVASNQSLWEFIQSLTTGGIRVPSRFIPLGSFGLMLFSVYGIEALRLRVHKYGLLVGVTCSVILVVLAGNWLYRAQKSKTLQSTPLARSGGEINDPRFLLGKYCPVGSGCLNTYQSGYDADPYIQYLTVNKITEDNLRAFIPKGVEVAATHLTLSSLKPGEVIDVPLRSASFGHHVATIPSEATPVVESFQGHLRIQGDPVKEIQRLEIRPALPFPLWSVWLAVITGFLSLLILLVYLLLPALNHSETTAHPQR